ncbi:alpha-glucuronidase family glycosyl hydrolase [Paraflavitalea sp. CAU 1676]|uniref:alpha-glucuronidase family glycosyl hydrolase n=1 Tax=Paraflavitalea sp. CAU 1676 TaxID=3032598 RepID=UPI0023D9D40D|nr:alpha-glucuronidase family glycosyl hydrolase [Paraflavitalea sp. CAU 1676]MDF2192288.1 alpha-glucuronidase family glycosyl hydrolase [Paraflavitalea sp. CAU 1676]
MKRTSCTLLLLLLFHCLLAEDGYRLWLRYDKIDNNSLLQQYQSAIRSVHIAGNSPVLMNARKELLTGLQGLLDTRISDKTSLETGTLLVATYNNHETIRSLIDQKDLNTLGNEGFIIRTVNSQQKKMLIITANDDAGLLYGVFHLLRLMQTRQPIQQLSITTAPAIQHRLLNHWDNLNRTVERGYAGSSIWDWHRLPGYLDPRYTDYARANASIGINGTVLTNVNANARILSKEYLEKVAALANVFRAYHIKVYLTARFSAPVELGGLKTADPLDPQVQDWWKKKAAEIYSYVPDFGGFLVKANSEGQPGPQNYNRTHADGANMLADAVAPHGGIVMWRAFVYSSEKPDDRFKQAYDEFKPLDGKFRKNVVVQVKNGPIDFQPREPFHPLFGAMPATPLMMEFQITQEYLGFATNLVYLAPLFKECLDSDTYAKGKGTTVAKIVNGSIDNHSLSGIAGVSNIGNDINWCGHPFAQSNWYAFGRLAWTPSLDAAQIANEWIRQTFSNNPSFVNPVQEFMLASRENTVQYMTPLGLHHIMGNSHHYGPAPWTNHAQRADWDPVYYHKADTTGIGFNRTTTGSNALAQYFPEVRRQYETLSSCPDDYLLWFHRVPWSYRLSSGKTVWQALCAQYYAGVDAVRRMQQTWNGLETYVDAERYNQVKQLMAMQEQEAVWWRNACLLYFQTYSRMPLPDGYEPPNQTLEYYMNLRFPFAPGI